MTTRQVDITMNKNDESDSIICFIMPNVRRAGSKFEDGKSFWFGKEGSLGFLDLSTSIREWDLLYPRYL